MLKVLTLDEIPLPNWEGKGNSLSPKVGEWLQPRSSNSNPVRAAYRVSDGISIYGAHIIYYILYKAQDSPAFEDASVH